MTRACSQETRVSANACNEREVRRELDPGAGPAPADADRQVTARRQPRPGPVPVLPIASAAPFKLGVDHPGAGVEAARLVLGRQQQPAIGEGLVT